MPLPERLEVFYDGACPLCRREAHLIARRDRQQRIALTDIAADDFDATSYELPMDTFMAAIQARTPEGKWLEGVEVFRVIYGILGFRCLVRVSRWPGMSWVLDRAYRLFAANRLRITGRTGRRLGRKIRAED
jgi:predicted DCC family thiol-disulfide oxidoreductase YuxK